MAFDGITTKVISDELQMLKSARIDKIFQPSKNNILIGCYLNRTNYLINISTQSPNYRIHLTTHPASNPQNAPSFCMLLRKHLLGLHIKNIVTSNLERIVTIEFEGFDDIDDIIYKKLIIELMGKHCNIILVDDNNIIIDSLRHIQNESEIHNVIPHTKYTYPKTNKLNFFDCNNFEEFLSNISYNDLSDIPSSISSKYNGISKVFVENTIKELNINDISKDSLNTLYTYIHDIVFSSNLDELCFKKVNYNYFLTKSNLDVKENADSFHLNFFIDDYYFNKETSENFKTYRNSLLKLILGNLNKYKKRLKNIDEKLANCENMDKYKLYGELITANLYRIPSKNLNEIELENYYDNNKIIKIPLDSKYLPSINAKRYFKKYNKLKNALEIVNIQKQETLSELEYIESIVYELESSTNIEELFDIYDEISENVIFKTSKIQNKKKNTNIKKTSLTKNKNAKFNPLKFNIDGFTFLVGRNNKENDYLTLKYSKKTDLWFHTKDIHGSHGVLILDNKEPSKDIILKCAEITAYHSKARMSSNVPVDTCKIKFVKKPKGAKPGMVIYTDYKTLYVTLKEK